MCISLVSNLQNVQILRKELANNVQMLRKELAKCTISAVDSYLNLNYFYRIMPLVNVAIDKESFDEEFFLSPQTKRSRVSENINFFIQKASGFIIRNHFYSEIIKLQV